MWLAKTIRQRQTKVKRSGQIIESSTEHMNSHAKTLTNADFPGTANQAAFPISSRIVIKPTSSGVTTTGLPSV